MKSYSLLLLFTFASLWAQKPDSGVLFTIGTEYEPAQITYTDGHKETGFVYGFIHNRWIEFANPLEIDEFTTIESELNLMDRRFLFKTTKEGEAKKLTQNDVNEVILNWDTDHPENFKLMDLKKVNGKGEIIDLKTRAWLPLSKKDKVNIFSFSIYENGNYSWTMVYLNNAKDNYAINPIDMNDINIFNLGKIDDKAIWVLKEVFKDCPEYTKTLDGNPKEIVSKYFKNKGNKLLKSEIKAFDQAHPDMKRRERIPYHNAIAEKIETDPYVQLIGEYTKTCPN